VQCEGPVRDPTRLAALASVNLAARPGRLGIDDGAPRQPYRGRSVLAAARGRRTAGVNPLAPDSRCGNGGQPSGVGPPFLFLPSTPAVFFARQAPLSVRCRGFSGVSSVMNRCSCDASGRSCGGARGRGWCAAVEAASCAAQMLAWTAATTEERMLAEAVRVALDGVRTSLAELSRPDSGA
jgi:hypothetical protein